MAWPTKGWLSFDRVSSWCWCAAMSELRDSYLWAGETVQFGEVAGPQRRPNSFDGSVYR